MNEKRRWAHGAGIAAVLVATLALSGCGSSGSAGSASGGSAGSGGSATSGSAGSGTSGSAGSGTSGSASSGTSGSAGSGSASSSSPSSGSSTSGSSGSASSNSASSGSSGSASSTSGSSGAQNVSLKGASFTVGGKEFTEQLNLCYLTVDVLKAHGATVDQKCGLNGSSTARQALTSGQIDMYWEYTGTAWVNYLHQTKRITDPTKLFDETAKMDLSKNKIKWIAPAPFNDTYAIIVKSSTADQLNVHSLSDYAKLVKSDPSKAKTCLASEFLSRSDGWPGLQKAYGFQLPRSETVTIAEGSIFQAVAQGSQCTFGEANSSTDGRIVSLKLSLLKDDKSFFPLYNPALNVRDEVYQKYPQLETLFKQVSSKLTGDAILQMNTNVDVKGQQAQDVAKKWAQQAGLLG